ncbi:sigma-54-dependent transcriptional regulator [Calditrichota bacterium GD2]
MARIKILVIDDEKLIGWSFKKEFDNKYFEVTTAESGEEGIKLFEKDFHDIVFLDNRLPGIQGLDVLKKLKQLRDDAYIIFMTAYGSIETAVEAMKMGAYEYINKPFNHDEIRILLQGIKDKIQLVHEVQLLCRDKPMDLTFNHIIGTSPSIRQAIQLAKRIATSKATTVLLLGESGTGKDIFASAIHNQSARKDRPFVPINCATLPENLLESELFGHERGAFTGAHKMKKGLLEIADGGTVFLNEIGELPLNTQSKLLTVLEYKTFRRVGGNEDINVDVRIIAATNRDLEKAVKDGKFRLDLLYRLKVFQIELPPLRERREDIPLLIDHFVEFLAKKFGKNIKGVTRESLQLLEHYDWPGNVRELINVLERAVILENSEYIQLDSLPFELKQIPPPAKINDVENWLEIPEEGFSLYQVEKKIIELVLKKAGYNKSKAAKLLGITRDTLRYKIKKYKLL